MSFFFLEKALITDVQLSLCSGERLAVYAERTQRPGGGGLNNVNDRHQGKAQVRIQPPSDSTVEEHISSDSMTR